MVNCYQSDFATRDRIGNKYLTFVETQSCCSDRNKPYTFKTQQNTVTVGVRKRNLDLHDTVVDCGRLHVKLAVGLRYKHKHTGEPHSHEFVHFMSLWSNRLETYDGVKKFVFKEKAICPLRVSGFLSFIWFVYVEVFFTYIHTAWGIGFSLTVKVKHFTVEGYYAVRFRVWTVQCQPLRQPLSQAEVGWKCGD